MPSAKGNKQQASRYSTEILYMFYFDILTHLSFPVAGPKWLFLNSFPIPLPQSITQISSVKKFASFFIALVNVSRGY